MQELFYTDTTISYKRTLIQVIITFLFSLTIGGIFSYDLIIFGTVLLGAGVVVFGVVKPKYMLYFILFSSSVLSFYPLARYTTFFEGTSYQINLQGLRNLLIIVVTVPLIIFNFKKVVRAKFFLPIVLYVFVFALTTIINFSTDDIRLFTNIVSPFLFYFLMLIFIKDESDKKAVLTAIILSSLIPIVVAFLQYFHVMRLYEKYSYNISGRRIHSTFDLANTFGVYMVMFSFISILKFVKEKKLLNKIWGGIYLVGAHLALLMTLSRNAIFSLLLASVIVANAKWGILRSVLVGFFLIIILFSIPGFNERLLSPSQKLDVSVFDVFTRFDFETLNFYSMGRLVIWKDWWEMILESTPKEHILGHGFDTKFIVGRYFHNEFLRTFWVSGIVGLVFYIYVILYMLYTIYSWMRRSIKRGEWNIYYLSAFSYIFAMTFMLNFDNIKEKHQIWIYYFALLALAEITKEKET
ncbi:MAG TPA: hypothetical protein ENG83_09505 [Nitrospirae bacterium]|nr:O-Antigen ligase [bacterium BMS3Abin06]HDH12409.1 hypothetical protein [Nitrospirota bacterium]HDY99845.1 hypothetical protein [Nitrospirota bacterium]